MVTGDLPTSCLPMRTYACGGVVDTTSLQVGSIAISSGSTAGSATGGAGATAATTGAGGGGTEAGSRSGDDRAHAIVTIPRVTTIAITVVVAVHDVDHQWLAAASGPCHHGAGISSLTSGSG